MKFFQWSKDGGPESKSWGFFFVEIKPLFSIVLLKFDHGSREAYHTHAFNAWSIVFNKGLREYILDDATAPLEPGFQFTPRNRFHKVYNENDRPVYALSFRGPWLNKWKEYLPLTKEFIGLTHGRKVIPV